MALLIVELVFSQGVQAVRVFAAGRVYPPEPRRAHVRDRGDRRAAL